MRVTIVCFEDPSASTHGGTMRTRAFFNAFTELGHDVSFCLLSNDAEQSPRRTPAPGTRSRLDRFGRLKRNYVPLPTAFAARQRITPARREQLASSDLVLFSNFEARAVISRARSPRIWFDQSDRHSRYARSESEHRGGVARMTSLLQARWLERQERNWLAECAVSTCAGFGDSQSFAVDEHEPPVWLPTPVVGAPYVREPRGRLPVAGFLANFRYAPNRLALESLLRSWLPGLQRQGWKLLVAGLGSDELELPAGATCAGQIDEVDEFYDAVGVTLAPVDRGGGMKVKVAESLAYGVPVIASPAALDGFPPHVRRFAVEVDSDRDLPMLSSLHESVIPSEIRDLFTPESFARTLDRLLVSHGMGGD